MRRVMKIISSIAVIALLLVSVPIEPAAAQSEWSVPVTAVTASEGSNPNLEFGTKSGATDSFDAGMDMPHPPYLTTFDVYFSVVHALFPQLDKDYRAPANTTIGWTLHVKSNTELITLTWDASAVPAEVPLWLTEAEIGLRVDMKAGNNTVLPAGAHTLKIATEEPLPCGVIALEQGWNLISLPLIPDDGNITAVLADIMGNVSIVWSYDAATGEWSSYIPGGPTPSLTTMVDGKGYWIDMNAAGNLTIEGVELPLPQGILPTYQVVEGWNLIGFKSCSSRIASDYLAGLEGHYSSIYGYDNGAPFLVAPGQAFSPGHGYWLAATEAGIIYP